MVLFVVVVSVLTLSSATVLKHNRYFLKVVECKNIILIRGKFSQDLYTESSIDSHASLNINPISFINMTEYITYKTSLTIQTFPFITKSYHFEVSIFAHV